MCFRLRTICVGVSGVATGDVSSDALGVPGLGRKAGVRVAFHIGAHCHNLGKAGPVGRTFNLEPTLVIRVIRPGQDDAAAGYSRCRQITGQIWGLALSVASMP